MSSPRSRDIWKNRQFRHTPWEDVEAAASDASAQREQALARLMDQYWPPVYCFLLRQGRSHHEAENLTQEFFCQVVLDGKLLSAADETRGRFRNLLLTALRRFCAMEYRKSQRKSRRPKGRLMSISDAQPFLPSDPHHSPDQAFARAWAVQLVRRVLRDVETGCVDDGLEKHWEIFRRCVVQPALHSQPAPSLEELCRTLGVDSPRQASNMRITVRRRFQAALRRHVRSLVDSEDRVDEEIRDLMKLLGGPAAQR